MTDTASTTTPDVEAPATVTPLRMRDVPRRGRRERRVLRRIDPLSVLKFSLVFYACVLVVVLVAGIVLWLLASVTGVVGNIEKFIGDLFALENFRFKALQILEASMLGGAVLALLGSGLNVLAALLYNLIAESVGGIEVTVSDEDTPPRAVV